MSNRAEAANVNSGCCVLLMLRSMTASLAVQDRTNLSFAAIQLNRDLQFSEYVYGLVRASSKCWHFVHHVVNRSGTMVVWMETLAALRVLRPYRHIHQGQ